MGHRLWVSSASGYESWVHEGKWSPLLQGPFQDTEVREQQQMDIVRGWKYTANPTAATRKLNQTSITSEPTMLAN